LKRDHATKTFSSLRDFLYLYLIMKQRIIITGPTASGKSSLAIGLAKTLNGEIISVDSRQCYKRIDIGTAKPTPADLDAVPHHNISVLDLDQPDTVATFTERVLNAADDIESRGKTAIFCGGSTLHIQTLIHPLDSLPSSDRENIAQLNRRADHGELEQLYEKLRQVDPEYAQKMDGLNRQRIIRALDVWMQTGKPFSSFHSDQQVTLPDNYRMFILHHPRKMLHQRIEQRTDQMMEEGLVRETEQILNDGYSADLQSLQTVGYRQVIDYLDGKLEYDRMVADIKTATRRYAKRQITWMRKWEFGKRINRHQLNEFQCLNYIQQQVAAKL
jgi:tRNA dimethylallyltransferase